MTDRRRAPAADDDIRLAKESLITRGLLAPARGQPDWLSDEIDRSWRRSITAGAERTPGAFHFVNEFDTDSELSRAARPVLDRLESTLQDMGTAIFLADRSGQIVARRVTSVSERARFDSANAAEGFDFSEERIGTNGLGTPISEGGAVFVRGPEHFNEALESLACAGIGIRHPTTGRLIGSLSLAAPVDAAEMLMLAMAREGAQQIVDNLSSMLGRREVSLGRSYQQHRRKGPVIVLNSDTVMTNVTGLSFLNVEMHARLWDSLLAQDWEKGPHVLDLDMQSLHARVLAHRLHDTEDAAFAVEVLARRPATGRPTGPGTAVAGAYVAGLDEVGSRHTGTLVVAGASGAGKLHVALEWLRAQGHPDPLVLDAGALGTRPQWHREASSALERGEAVLLRRVENLDVRDLGAVKALSDDVTRHRSTPPVSPTVQPAARRARLVLTADRDACPRDVLRLLGQVAEGVDVLPLASRRDEIPSLVEALLGEMAPERRPVPSSATMQALMRWEWPGNVAELRHVLRRLATERPGQAVSPYHLPERMWDAANRRPLSRLESVERTEILTALRQSRGNRSQAAKLLGIGRTTLYRKLHAHGIDDDTLLP